MKFISVLTSFTILALTVSSFAADTAYTALSAVGKVKGQTYLDNLLNLEGLEGSSQPGTWRMIFEDSTSRAGFREVEVRGGQIVSQSTPLKSPFATGDRVNLDRLQLDSDGAFTVAEREATQEGISFSTANYLLTTDGPAGAPIWRVQLVDSADRIVQTLRISADTGRVIGGSGGPQRRIEREDEATARPRESANEVTVFDEPESPSDSTELKINRTLRRTGVKINNGFKHIGGSFQEIFTGRRTIDKDLPGE